MQWYTWEGDETFCESLLSFHHVGVGVAFRLSNTAASQAPLHAKPSCWPSSVFLMASWAIKEVASFPEHWVTSDGQEASWGKRLLRCNTNSPTILNTYNYNTPKPFPPFLAPVWSVTWEPYPYTRALLSIWWWTATPPPTRSVCDDGRLPIVSCVSCLVTGFHPGQQDSAPVSKKDEAFPLPVSHGLDSPPPPATRCQLVSASKMDHLWQDSWATNLSTVLPLKEGRRGWGEEIQTPFFSPLGFDVCFTAVKRFER